MGYQVRADYKLATYEETIDYFQQLDKLSEFMEMRDAGFTSEGRMIKYAIIYSPENLKRLDRYVEISQSLAHPESLDNGTARKLAT